MSSPYNGKVTYWSCVLGYGFVRSEQLPGRLTVYRDSFMGEKVGEDSLEGRMVRFKLQEDPSSRMEVIKNVELMSIRERTWSEMVQECEGGVEVGHEVTGGGHDVAEAVAGAVDRQEVTTGHSRDRKSGGGGGSVLDLLPFYLFKGIIVTFKLSDSFGFIRSGRVTCMCMWTRWTLG